MIERYTFPGMGRLWTEQAKYERWLQVELAATEAQAELGYVPDDVPGKIREKAAFDVDRIAQIEEEVHHDVLAFLTSISESLGEEGRFVHYGMTSSDVVDTSLCVAMRDAADLLIQDVKELKVVLKEQAIRYKHTIMVGRTHGVHAEPTTFGLKILIWYFEMQRNLERLETARQVISVGKFSGAVGNYSNIDPRVEGLACDQLKLNASPASSQVIQRDRHAQYLTTIAVVGATIEKIATEIRHLQRTEVLEVEEPFLAGQKGSSAMPHKRNPIITERLSGLARLLRGYAQTALENVALWHERDISHSSVERVTIPDATILLDYMLQKLTRVMKGLQVYPQNMSKNLADSHGLVFSQHVLLVLIDKGLAREEAYSLVQRNAMLSWKEKTSFQQLLLDDEEVSKHLSASDIDACFEVSHYLENIDKIFERMD
ncbi:MAG TPA: adenylosuccinate lyase [Actinobacteria bacterium]|nr:adenylosuccinate lyase [Actinomycetota bacterium]